MWWIGRVWRRVERVLYRVRRWMRRRQRQLEQGLVQIGKDLWALVDDFPELFSSATIAPVWNQYYAHGSFMGAAPSLLRDARWRRILAFLMPDVYSDVLAAVKDNAEPHRIIPMFENNPVMAAYGTWKSAELRRRPGVMVGPHDLSGHEWDVFVDSELVRQWERAAPEKAPAVLARLVNTMLVAHATSTDTLQEQVGLDQYPDVRRTRKTAMGGVEVTAWMDLFARALELAEADDLNAAVVQMAAERRHKHVEECREHTFVNARPFSDAVARYRAVTGKRHFSVVLEIKSLRSTPRLLTAVTDLLNERGVHVCAVGSFQLDEIRGLAEHAQAVAGDALPGPREVLFFHTAGDLQAACDAGRIPRGQHALFNGASLIDDGFRPDEALLAELEVYQERHDLHLGFYVQEGDCDAAAAEALSRLAHERAGTFELGFAWGGLQDEATVLGAGDRRGFGSQALLVRVGLAKMWQFRDRERV